MLTFLSQHLSLATYRSRIRAFRDERVAIKTRGALPGIPRRALRHSLLLSQLSVLRHTRTCGFVAMVMVVVMGRCEVCENHNVLLYKIMPSESSKNHLEFTQIPGFPGAMHMRGAQAPRWATHSTGSGSPLSESRRGEKRIVNDPERLARFIGLLSQPKADLRRRRISLWLTPSLRRSPVVPLPAGRQASGHRLQDHLPSGAHG